MIKVENLTKRYAGQAAIQDLNFEVGQGEIMGFLGQTANYHDAHFSQFIPRLLGRATVAGAMFLEVAAGPRRISAHAENGRSIDMRVTEYHLDYRAALKGSHRRLMGELEM
jgi:ABC-2 type transport system ATP-binding protein